jgi:amino acid transporter
MKKRNALEWIKEILVGKGRSLSDDKLFHKVSLIALFAWVGLGADGLSSSCYGPEEAFKALGAHAVLAPFIALACLATIGVLCASYAQIIEVFPGGGGGYLVASKLLSPGVGVVSGCALLVDYVLTIAISLASGTDALFSLLPVGWQAWKLPFALGGALFLTVLNLRGVRESVLLWVPVFFVFLATHAFAIAFGMLTHLADLGAVAASTGADLKLARAELGWVGVFALLVRAYSVGAGTYTGIEAVSNGLPVLREPRVATGKRTMLYMGLSLALTVGGLLISYLLYRVEPQTGKTLNAVLFGQITGHWPAPLGRAFVSTAMVAATALLFIAAQAGFLDGPRVLANMAFDRWFPARFASLSDRLVAQNGIVLMGVAALIVLVVTNGSVGLLVVLYSINVFITFTLSQLGMMRHWWASRGTAAGWMRKLAVNGVGFCLTAFILAMLSVLKFREGGWVTLLVTGLLVGTAYATHGHYRHVLRDLVRLDLLAGQFEREVVDGSVPAASGPPACDSAAKTAVILVNGFNGLGVHTLLAVNRMFPDVFRNYVFLCAGPVDAGNFKGAGEIEHLRRHIAREAERYVEQMKRRGFCAEAMTDIGTDIIETVGDLAARVSKRFPHAVFFGGQLVFARDSWMVRLLHNYVVFALQRKLFRQGTPFLILPVRV